MYILPQLQNGCATAVKSEIMTTIINRSWVSLATNDFQRNIMCYIHRLIIEQIIYVGTLFAERRVIAILSHHTSKNLITSVISSSLLLQAL